MRAHRAIAAVVLAAGMIVLQACGGGGADMDLRTTTVGQELTDLQNAYEAGAMSEREYERQREVILDRR